MTGLRRVLTAAFLLAAACGGGDNSRAAAKYGGERICGSSSILGEPAPRIAGSASGCGLSGGVRVYSVAGVGLSPAATVDCSTAKALDKWVRRSVKPAIGSRGGGLEKLKVFSSYSCRPRNNQSGARISEHGRGKAIDIGGFRLQDGSEITVLDGWGTWRQGGMLKRMHRGACGTFGTVLGPNSDGYHSNHFHLDTARHRSGPYCR